MYRTLGKEIEDCFSDESPHGHVKKTNIQVKLPKMIRALMLGKTLAFARSTSGVSMYEFRSWQSVVTSFYGAQGIQYSPLDVLVEEARALKKEENLKKVEEASVKKGNVHAYLAIAAYRDKREKDETPPKPQVYGKKRGRPPKININAENLNLGIPKDMYEVSPDSPALPSG